ncbi:hypothetical protein [Geminicoccus harenae]|uniref:hypothetical protein n=1 Tax=Geminicoccus harenae TaxID=2498453 RepID=UPI00168BED10|nr:hypothetical protein [Geminicoccus harenae]
MPSTTSVDPPVIQTVSAADPAIEQYVAEARLAATALDQQLAHLREVALTEAVLLEGKSVGRVLVAAGHAAWQVMESHGFGEREIALETGRMVQELQATVRERKRKADKPQFDIGTTTNLTALPTVGSDW